MTRPFKASPQLLLFRAISATVIKQLFTNNALDVQKLFPMPLSALTMSMSLKVDLLRPGIFALALA